MHLFYKAIGSLWCSAIKDTVFFNNHGWIHLRYDSKGHKRIAAAIRLRFFLLQHVSEVIQQSKVMLKQTSGFITSRNGVQRRVTYYEIAHKVNKGKYHITVILRRIEEGKLHYYSIRRTRAKIKKALEGLH